jgi:hypothetical protein
MDCTPFVDRYCKSGVGKLLMNCVIKSNVLCLGNRNFKKIEICNFYKGKKYFIAFFLSAIFGGFGFDRFYLGYYGWGILKLISFSGII